MQQPTLFDSSALESRDTKPSPRPAHYTSAIPLHYGFYVYRCWSANGTCLYVGRSKQVPCRLGQHARFNWWTEVHRVDVAVFATAAEADAEEITQIRQRQPVNNVQLNRAWVRKSTIRPVTHCKNGHEYTPTNTLFNGAGTKVCRTCKNTKAREKNAANLVGRPQGEERSNAKLDRFQVADIWRRHALGVSPGKLARHYGVSRAAVRAVLEGRSWRHVKVPTMTTPSAPGEEKGL